MKCTQKNSAHDLPTCWLRNQCHYSDVIISMVASQITGVSIVYTTVCSGTDQRKHQRFVPLAFVAGEFPAQKASNTENISIWWRHHGYVTSKMLYHKWMMVLRSFLQPSQSSFTMRQSTWWISYISISKSNCPFKLMRSSESGNCACNLCAISVPTGLQSGPTISFPWWLFHSWVFTHKWAEKWCILTIWFLTIWIWFLFLG